MRALISAWLYCGAVILGSGLLAWCIWSALRIGNKPRLVVSVVPSLLVALVAIVVPLYSAQSVLTGRPSWTAGVPGGHLVLQRGWIYVRSANSLSVVDPDTGEVTGFLTYDDGQVSISSAGDLYLQTTGGSQAAPKEGEVIAYTDEGKELWKRSGTVLAERSGTAVVVECGGVVATGVDCTLVGVDSVSGVLRWTRKDVQLPRDSPRFRQPSLPMFRFGADGWVQSALPELVVVQATPTGGVQVIDPRTGRTVDTFLAGSVAVAGAVAVNVGRSGSGCQISAHRDGRTLWTVPQSQLDSCNPSSVTLIGSRLYKGEITVNLQTGKVSTVRPIDVGISMDRNVSAGDDRVVVHIDKGGLYCAADAESGEQLWCTQPDGEAPQILTVNQGTVVVQSHIVSYNPFISRTEADAFLLTVIDARSGTVTGRKLNQSAVQRRDLLPLGPGRIAVMVEDAQLISIGGEEQDLLLLAGPS